MNFFPQSHNYGRSVVRSVDIDCAREDTLSVFIPSARLDAARFDGLTVLALDKQGQEFPIFIPPNYIEGFEMAVGGRFRSQSDRGEPLPRVIYKDRTRSLPDTIIQAECPTGTQKQSDGSCLVISGRYP